MPYEGGEGDLTPEQLENIKKPIGEDARIAEKRRVIAEAVEREHGVVLSRNHPDPIERAAQKEVMIEAILRDIKEERAKKKVEIVR